MKIIECPRDAMQGLADFIPTDSKASYINQLLKVGFHTIDFGSFVSPKAIPQMRDTADVLKLLDLSNTKSKLLAIVANLRGAQDASQFDEIDFLGFPFSISETFQKRNTNKSIREALAALDEIQNICIQSNKKLVAYISMGFGNPYGDPYNLDVVYSYADKLISKGILIISLADTIGVSQKDQITHLFTNLSKEYSEVEFGAHLHSTPERAHEKVSAAFAAGCRRFDGAIKGYGGCPMAKDDLVGNMDTQLIYSYLKSNGEATDMDDEAFQKAVEMAAEVFPS